MASTSARPWHCNLCVPKTCGPGVNWDGQWWKPSWHPMFFGTQTMILDCFTICFTTEIHKPSMASHIMPNNFWYMQISWTQSHWHHHDSSVSRFHLATADVVLLHFQIHASSIVIFSESFIVIPVLRLAARDPYNLYCSHGKFCGHTSSTKSDGQWHYNQHGCQLPVPCRQLGTRATSSDGLDQVHCWWPHLVVPPMCHTRLPIMAVLAKDKEPTIPEVQPVSEAMGWELLPTGAP